MLNFFLVVEQKQFERGGNLSSGKKWKTNREGLNYAASPDEDEDDWKNIFVRSKSSVKKRGGCGMRAKNMKKRNTLPCLFPTIFVDDLWSLMLLSRVKHFFLCDFHGKIWRESCFVFFRIMKSQSEQTAFFSVLRLKSIKPSFRLMLTCKPSLHVKDESKIILTVFILFWSLLKCSGKKNDFVNVLSCFHPRTKWSIQSHRGVGFV